MNLRAIRAADPAPTWLRALRIYLAVILIGNLMWETLHLPLYTIWTDGSPRWQAFAVFHCTLGDVLIALSGLILALLIAGDVRWPEKSFVPVLGLTLVFGVAYTTFSEWLNVVVRASWAYSEWMPVLSLFSLKIGVSPLLQWIVVPTVAFASVRKFVRGDVRGD